MAISVHAQPVRDNYLSFALGAIPVAIGGDAAARTAFSHAVAAIDGSLNVYSYTTLVAPATVVELVFELPAPTTFDRFAIPNVARRRAQVRRSCATSPCTVPRRRRLKATRCSPPQR
jgi:hypothetical protein